jgi:hypothetical protein
MVRWCASEALEVIHGVGIVVFGEIWGEENFILRAGGVRESEIKCASTRGLCWNEAIHGMSEGVGVRPPLHLGSIGLTLMISCSVISAFGAALWRGAQIVAA